MCTRFCGIMWRVYFPAFLHRDTPLSAGRSEWGMRGLWIPTCVFCLYKTYKPRVWCHCLAAWLDCPRRRYHASLLLQHLLFSAFTPIHNYFFQHSHSLSHRFSLSRAHAHPWQKERFAVLTQRTPSPPDIFVPSNLHFIIDLMNDT